MKMNKIKPFLKSLFKDPTWIPGVFVGVLSFLMSFLWYQLSKDNFNTVNRPILGIKKIHPFSEQRNKIQLFIINSGNVPAKNVVPKYKLILNSKVIETGLIGEPPILVFPQTEEHFIIRPNGIYFDNLNNDTTEFKVEIYLSYDGVNGKKYLTNQNYRYMYDHYYFSQYSSDFK